MKKKGFTMVELLAVVVILGIIGTIGVVGVTKIIKSSHERHNIAQAKLFVSGAQMYFTDNKSKLPTKTFTSKEISLKELQEKNYIEKIVDYKKDEYDKEKSYAYVTKMGTGKYAYDGELLTKEGERTKYKPQSNDNGKVTFYIGNQNFTNRTVYTNAKSNKVVKVLIEDPDTIAGYIITLYKGGKELRELEYKEIGNQTQVETKITIRPEEYPDGQYRIQVKVVDIYNNQKTAKSGTLIVDTIAPQCETILKGTNGKNNWYISNVETKAECTDLDEKGNKKNVSGCASKVLLTTTGATENVENKEVGEWKIQKNGVSYLTYKVSDRAGNETVCKTTEVKKDTEKPTCTSVAAGPDAVDANGYVEWTNNNRNITGSCSDNISGCVVENVMKIIDTSAEKASPGIVVDNAGNETNCGDINVYIDKGVPRWKPDCAGNPNCNGNGITSLHNGQWFNQKQYENSGNNGYRMGQYYDPSISGIKAIKRYRQNSLGLWDYLDEVIYPGPGVNANFTNNYRKTNYYYDDQNNNIGFQIVNRANSTSEISSVSIKIDKVAPTIDGFNIGGNGSHSVNCSDSLSGVKKLVKYSTTPGWVTGIEIDEGTGEPWMQTTAIWDATGVKNPAFACKDAAGNSSTASYPAKCTSCSDGSGKDPNWKNCHNHGLSINCSSGH
ncbi:MAG: type II secretion system protein [Bacilli bacterium]|nr:type II secretion system protein [Bacilli bacterium]